MKALFFIIIFIAIAVACWQFVKLLGLTKVENATATPKENNINGWLMLVLMAFLYGLMLWSMYGAKDVLLPQLSASEEGYHIDILFKITMGFDLGGTIHPSIFDLLFFLEIQRDRR